MLQRRCLQSLKDSHTRSRQERKGYDMKANRKTLNETITPCSIPRLLWNPGSLLWEATCNREGVCNHLRNPNAIVARMQG